MDNKIITISQSEGEILGVAGDNYRIIISGKETNGAYTVIEMIVPPGGGPLPHSHPDMQEMFYIIDGEIEFRTEQGKITVSKGRLVNIPFGGAVHCFKNVSRQNARMLCTVIPAGLEDVFRSIGAPVQAGEFLPVPENTPERLALLKEIDIKYHQKTFPADYFDGM